MSVTHEKVIMKTAYPDVLIYCMKSWWEFF